jgi:hypothetical protein
MSHRLSKERQAIQAGTGSPSRHRLSKETQAIKGDTGYQKRHRLSKPAQAEANQVLSSSLPQLFQGNYIAEVTPASFQIPCISSVLLQSALHSPRNLKHYLQTTKEKKRKLNTNKQI